MDVSIVTRCISITSSPIVNGLAPVDTPDIKTAGAFLDVRERSDSGEVWITLIDQSLALLQLLFCITVLTFVFLRDHRSLHGPGLRCR